MEVFKIKNNKTGLYSSGSTRPDFTDKGKTWMTRGSVSGHLAQFSENQIKRIYQDCSVVTMKMVVLSEEPMDQIVQGIKKRREIREAESSRRTAEYQRQQAIDLLKKIEASHPELFRNAQ